MRSLARNQRGMTLIEIMVTLALVGMVVIIAFDITNASGQVNARTKIYAEANSLAFGKMQDYETQRFEDIPVGVEANAFEVEDWSAEAEAESNGLVKQANAKVYTEFEDGSRSLMKVRVVLFFQYGPTQRLIEYATYIQLGGVGR